MGSEVEKKKIVIFYHFMLRCQMGWTACLTCGLACQKIRLGWPDPIIVVGCVGPKATTHRAIKITCMIAVLNKHILVEKHRKG